MANNCTHIHTHTHTYTHIHTHIYTNGPSLHYLPRPGPRRRGVSSAGGEEQEEDAAQQIKGAAEHALDGGQRALDAAAVEEEHGCIFGGWLVVCV